MGKAPRRIVSWKLLIAWTVVFTLNLFIPLAFSYLVTEGRGELGILAAVWVAWAIGIVVCFSSPDRARVIVRGCVYLAASQMFPVLQIVAGIPAAFVIGRFQKAMGSDLAGFAGTMLTGAVLSSIAYGLGVLARSQDARLKPEKPATDAYGDFG